MNDGRPGRSLEAGVLALDGDTSTRKYDRVVTEEPLELRVGHKGQTKTLAVTMRTPGNDFELAAGFAYAEGLVARRDEIVDLTYCVDAAVDPVQRYNIVTLELNRPNALADLERLERHFTVNSSCGVCGRAQLDALGDLGVEPIDDDLRVGAGVLHALPDRMRALQRVFATTGGLHAAALFDGRGERQVLREDIGRHNAVDKVAGWGLLERRLPFTGSILLVSGRASYEILQKSLMARIPIVCSVSAPSSLAVQLAREFNVTLVGFLRGNRANVYAGEHRIAR